MSVQVVRHSLLLPVFSTESFTRSLQQGGRDLHPDWFAAPERENLQGVPFLCYQDERTAYQKERVHHFI